MSKFKVGDRVRDVSPFAPGLGTGAGTIIGKDEGDNWKINWDATPYYQINWHDDQIEILDGSSRVIGGMTLRDWFAGQMMAAIIGSPGAQVSIDGPHVGSKQAATAYAIADAMLAERSKP